MANIRTFSLKRDGNKQLTKNFSVREFRSKDGTDKIKIHLAGVNRLQVIRNSLKRALIIQSAYRTVNHNAIVRGSRNSRHLKGTAFDIPTNRNIAQANEIAREAERAGFTGIYIASYNRFVHMDNRTPVWFTRQNANGTFTRIGTFGGAIFNLTRQLGRGMRGNDVLRYKKRLRELGYSGFDNTNKFGIGTHYATLRLQRDWGLIANGWVGPNTARAVGFSFQGK